MLIKPIKSLPVSWVNATALSYAQRHLQTQHTKKRSEGRRAEGKKGGKKKKRWETVGR